MYYDTRIVVGFQYLPLEIDIEIETKELDC